MSEPFLAEIRIFAGNFAPRNWAFCDGQVLPVAQNTALFSLIGTTYGGDGRTTTALPNLQGRAPMHPGRGSGLTARRLGQTTGVETVTLSEAQMPSHQHSAVASTDPDDDNDPNWLASSGTRFGGDYAVNTSALANMQTSPNILGNAGGGQAHNNVQPFLAMTFIIALQGLYPSRS